MDRNKNTETKNSQLDTFQSMLDAAGFVPGYGEPADLLNALISLGRGNKKEAAISTLSALPFLGMIGGVKKLKPFKNVKFRKTGPKEKDYIITNRKEVAESVADDFLNIGENLTNKARKQNEEIYNSLIDIYDPKQQGRAIGEIADEYLAKAPDPLELEFSLDDLKRIFTNIVDSRTKKDLFDVFRKAGKN